MLDEASFAVLIESLSRKFNFRLSVDVALQCNPLVCPWSFIYQVVGDVLVMEVANSPKDVQYYTSTSSTIIVLRLPCETSPAKLKASTDFSSGKV